MRKILTVSFILLTSLIFIVIAFLYIQFHTFKPSDKHLCTNNAYSNYYSSCYDSARLQFLTQTQALSEQFEGTQKFRFQIPGKRDTALYTDVFYLPAQDKSERLLILSSGLHGIEGFAGSAVQKLYIEKLLQVEDFQHTGVLLIHALNPYGYKYHRKVTENNVDLNRNCMVLPEQFNTPNEGFKKIRSMLTPEGQLNLGQLKHQFFPLIAISKILQEGMPVLRQAALQGQYDFQDGIYYGGKKHEPQIDSIKPVIKQIIDHYPLTLHIDLHTGYGERGTMHLFLDPIEDQQVLKGIETIFADQSIDWGSGDDFYTINGAYVDLVSSLADSSIVLPMLFEFGTMNSSSTMGSLVSIHTMIAENQGANKGYKNEKQSQKADQLIMELYNPGSTPWKNETIKDAAEAFDSFYPKFTAYQAE